MEVTPTRRIAIAGITVITLITAAIGISMWRSVVASSQSDVALNDQKQLVVAAAGRDLLFDEARLRAAHRRLTASDHALLARDEQEFEQLIKRAAVGGDATDRLLLAQLGPVATDAPTADRALDKFVTYNTADSASSAARARGAHRSALIAAVGGGGLAVLLAAILMLYVNSVLRKYFAQIRADEQLLDERLRELEQSRLETLERLALAAEYRDDDTLQHTERVGATAALIAERLGLPDETVDLLRLAAPLHDVGKLGISDTILRKPGPLTDAERETMKEHSATGAAILGGSHYSVLQLAELIARSHHERWDGNGYPDRLAGDAIPLAARIVAVADVFDALTHERPYKHAWPAADALSEIRRQAGAQFDPGVVAAFLSLDHDLTATPSLALVAA
jgi:putative nucleotidyltransferase with HDIG domain